MSKAIDQYIDRVMIYANPKPADEPSLRAELRDHLETKVEQLKAGGTAAEDAVFAALEDHGPAWRVGYGLRPKWPWIDIRAKGTARGVIAIGPKAVGVFACGGAAVGVFAMGGLAAGLVTWGGVGFALLFTWAGVGLAPLVFAGLAAGIFAVGGSAVGIVAIGGTAAGLWAQGAKVFSVYEWNTCPAWASGIVKLVDAHQSTFHGIVILATLGLLLLLLSMMSMQVREARRIAKADPQMAE